MSEPATGGSRGDRHEASFLRLMAETHRGNLDVVDELVSENVVTHGFFGMDATDRDGYRAFFEGFGAAFREQQFVVEELVTQGDLLVVRFSMGAVHRGPILGIEPTGRRLSWTGTAIDRYEDGRIVEAWLFPDYLTILDRLGVLPDGVGA